MKQVDAQEVLLYYADISKRLRVLARERWKIEDEYNPLHGAPLDGMPKTSRCGDSTGVAALRLAETGNADRLHELAVQAAVLRGDAEHIRRQLDRLRSQHKIVLLEKYVDGHTWEVTSGKIGLSRRQTIRVAEDALRHFGSKLDDVPMVEEIIARAHDARD